MGNRYGGPNMVPFCTSNGLAKHKVTDGINYLRVPTAHSPQRACASAWTRLWSGQRPQEHCLRLWASSVRSQTCSSQVWMIDWAPHKVYSDSGWTAEEFNRDLSLCYCWIAGISSKEFCHRFLPQVSVPGADVLFKEPKFKNVSGFLYGMGPNPG